MSIVNILVISQSLFLTYQSGSFIKNKNFIVDSDHLIPLSKTEKNVIVFIPDMFQGWSMNTFLETNPEIAQEYDGFVWYPNTLSISRVTNSSMPSLIGGPEFMPKKIDSDTVHTLRYKMSNSLNSLAKEVHEKGYSYTTNKLPYVDFDKIEYDSYLPGWHKDWNIFNKDLSISGIENSSFQILTNNSLFYSLPLFIKPRIYNGGKWFSVFKPQEEEHKNDWVAKKYNFLRLLPYISSNKSTKANFITLYSLVTHSPWNYIDDTGKLVEDVSPIVVDKWTIKTFSKWIKWMKENDVYDNTKIIIVSDHGVHWNHYKKEIDIDNPFINNTNERVHIRSLYGLNPLLLVKDFDAKGELKKDWRFMSNTDVRSIALNDNNITKGEPLKERTLEGYIAFWDKNTDKRKQLAVTHYFEVKNNVFDVNNWTQRDYNIEVKKLTDTYEEEISKFKALVRANKSWIKQTSDKAKLRGISVDSMMTRDA